MPDIIIDLDNGGCRPIVEIFSNLDYNQNFNVILRHVTGRRINVEKYPLLCSIINEIRMGNNQVNVTLDHNGNCQQLIYAERMGFLSFMGVNFDYPLNRRAGGGRFIEVRNINRIFYPEHELLQVFQRDFNLTQNQAEDIAVIMSELTNNAYMHSESHGGAILYCQKYPSQNYLNLFIVDSGRGIYNAMKDVDRYNKLCELDIFRKSLEFGEGNGNGHGQGLFLTSEFIKRNNGFLRLITGHYFCTINKGTCSFTPIDMEYKGVILNLKIPYIINTTIEDIMAEQIN